MFFLFLFCIFVPHALAHPTPCNQGNDTQCLEGIRNEFTRDDWWWSANYDIACDTEPKASTWMCRIMNYDKVHKTTAGRLLRIDDGTFDTNTITQFLEMEYMVPAQKYIACGETVHVDRYQSYKIIDNTHTIYIDMSQMNHRPNIRFEPDEGKMYTLIAYDVGFLKLGGMWVNIMTRDTSTGTEIYPHMGPKNANWKVRNQFIYAIFEQDSEITNFNEQKMKIMESMKANNGHYFINGLITEYKLKGPIGVGYIVVKTDKFGIQYFKDKEHYNNCPYIASKNSEVTMALKVMGVPESSFYSDYRGAFLTDLEVEIMASFHQDEVHFDSCCKHVNIWDKYVDVIPTSDEPIYSVATRHKPMVKLEQVELAIDKYFYDKMHTLFLLDITDVAENKTNADTIIHWKVVNIPKGQVDKGEEVLAYKPVVPMMSDRIMMFVLVEQTGHHSVSGMWHYTGSQCQEPFLLRCHFDFEAYQQNLHTKLVGIAKFHVSMDHFSRAVMYGDVDMNDMAKNHNEFMTKQRLRKYMESNNMMKEPHMKKSDVCKDQPEYSDPCPDMCDQEHHNMEHTTQSTDEHEHHNH